VLPGGARCPRGIRSRGVRGRRLPLAAGREIFIRWGGVRNPNPHHFPVSVLAAGFGKWLAQSAFFWPFTHSGLFGAGVAVVPAGGGLGHRGTPGYAGRWEAAFSSQHRSPGTPRTPPGLPQPHAVPEPEQGDPPAPRTPNPHPQRVSGSRALWDPPAQGW